MRPLRTGLRPCDVMFRLSSKVNLRPAEGKALSSLQGEDMPNPAILITDRAMRLVKALPSSSWTSLCDCEANVHKLRMWAYLLGKSTSWVAKISCIKPAVAVHTKAELLCRHVISSVWNFSSSNYCGERRLGDCSMSSMIESSRSQYRRTAAVRAGVRSGHLVE